MTHAAHEKKERRGYMYMENEYVIEMLNITKEFPGIKANDNITLQLRKGDRKSTLFGKQETRGT